MVLGNINVFSLVQSRQNKSSYEREQPARHPDGWNTLTQGRARAVSKPTVDCHSLSYCRSCLFAPLQSLRECGYHSENASASVNS
jgi:hypothetical protein